MKEDDNLYLGFERREEEIDMKTRLLFLGVDNSVMDAVTYAKSKGIHTIVTDFNPPEKVKEKQLADDYWMISVADLDALEQKCREEKVTHVYAGNHEFCIDQCKKICERLGLPFYASDEGWRASRDKAYYKEKCREVGLETPKRYALDENFKRSDLDKIHYPVIVKPTDSCAQQGLAVVREEKMLKEAYEKALPFSEKKDILVEDYIDGDEVYLFCFLNDGKLTMFGLSEDMMTEINGRKNFGFGIHVSAYLQYIKEELLPKFEKLADNLGCRNGACVFQGIFKDGIYYNLEYGYRLDGIRSWRHFKRLYGFSQLELMVDLAAGMDISDRDWKSVEMNDHKEISVGYMIWCKPGEIDRITGRDEMYQRDDIVFLLDNFNEGDVVQPNDNMRSIAFDITIYADNHEEMDQKIREINEMLHFYDKQGNDLLIHINGYYEQIKQRWNN